MSKNKSERAWDAVKGKWAYIKPKLKTAWAIICDVIIELYKPIEKFASWVHRFASKTPIRIAASAILTCVFLIGICSYFIYPLFFSSTLSFSRFGQISLGVTGLFTLGVVIWRGILHAHEEKLQAAQLRETQNNNVVQLLVEGTKLIGKNTSEVEKMAGVACLANIIKGSSSFAEQAADVIHSFIILRAETFNNCINGGDYIINAAFSAISVYSIKKRKEYDFQGISFIRVDFKKYKMFSQNFMRIHYKNCWFWNEDINWTASKFNDCKFYDCIINKCSFIGTNNFYTCLWRSTSNLGIRQSFTEPADVKQIDNCYYGDHLPPESFQGFDFQPISKYPVGVPPIGPQTT